MGLGTDREKAARLEKPRVNQKLVEALNAAELELTRALEERDNLKRQVNRDIDGALFSCPCCGHQVPIREMSWLYHNFYVRPHGCTGGDYWQRNKSRTADYIECRCGERFYLPWFTDEMQKLLLALMPHFKERRDERIENKVFSR